MLLIISIYTSLIQSIDGIRCRTHNLSWLYRYHLFVGVYADIEVLRTFLWKMSYNKCFETHTTLKAYNKQISDKTFYFVVMFKATCNTTHSSILRPSPWQRPWNGTNAFENMVVTVCRYINNKEVCDSDSIT